jgi:hypothetical protein
MNDTVEDLAVYILEWLRNRNGAELMDSFDNMTVRDFRNLKEALQLILRHDGQPPNWIK